MHKTQMPYTNVQHVAEEEKKPITRVLPLNVIKINHIKRSIKSVRTNNRVIKCPTYI